MKNVKRILFISKEDFTFSENDRHILERESKVVYYRYRAGGYFQTFTSQTLMLVFLLLRFRSFDLVYVWFADYHSLLPVFFARLFRKKSCIVIGGFDAARVEELNYGGHTESFRSWVIRKSCDLADLLLPVSRFTMKEMANKMNGKNEEKMRIIYNGTDTDVFNKIPSTKKQPVVATVCGARYVKTALRKGADLYKEVARFLPRIQFRIIGLRDDALQFVATDCPANLTIHGFLSRQQVVKQLSAAKVVCQFSRYEAFGVALIEGMLCECIPVGYRFGGGTAEIIPPHFGFLFDQWDVREAARTVMEALEAPAELGASAREWAMKKFSIDKRATLLVDAIEDLLTK